MRLRTLAERLGIQEKDFATIKAKAGSGLKALILAAALGTVPDDKAAEKKHYQSHARPGSSRSKAAANLPERSSVSASGQALKPQLMPFCNAVRKAVDLDEIPDLKP